MLKTKSKFIRRFALGMAILSIMSILGITLVSNMVVRDIIYDNVLGIAHRYGKLYAGEIDRWFTIADQTVQNLATTLNTLPTTEHFRDIAVNFVNEYDFIENVFIGFADGSLLNGRTPRWMPDDAGAELEGIGWGPWEKWSSTDRPWFIDAKAAGFGTTITTTPYISYATGNFTAAISTWLPELGGVGAAVGFSMAIQDFFTEIVAYTVMGGGYVILLGPDGEIIIHPNHDYIRINMNLRNLTGGDFLMASIESGNEIIEFYDPIMGPSYFISVPLDSTGWTFVTVVPTLVTTGAINQYMIRVVSVFTVFMLVVLGVGMAVVMRFSRSAAEREQEADTKIREATEFNEIFLNFAPFGVIMLDDKFDFISANRQAIVMFEASGERKVLEDMIPELQPCGTPSKKKIFDYYEKAKKEGVIWFEFTWRTEKGNPLPSETTFTITKHHDRDILLIYVNDISSIKEAMDTERRAEKRIQTLMDTCPLAVSIFDEQWNEIYCNLTTVEMFGHEIYDLSRPAAFFIHENQPDNRTSDEIFRMICEEVSNNGRYRTELLMQKTDGTPVLTDAMYLRLDYGDHYLVAAYYRNLTEEKAAKEREREAESRTRALLDACPLAVTLCDTDWKELSCNPAALKLFGLDETYELGQSANIYVQEIQPDGRHIDEVDEAILKELMETGYSHVELVCLKRDGTPMLLDTTYVRLDYSDHILFASYCRDLTEEKAAKERERERETQEAVRRRMQIMLNSSPLACFILDENFNVLELNQATLNLFKAENRQDFIDNFFRFIPEYQPNGELSVKKMRQRMDSTDETCHYEFWAQTMQGEDLPCEIHSTRVDAKMAAVHVRDMRDFYKYKELNERTQLMFDTAPLMIEYWDQDSRSVDCNKATLDFFGFSSKEEYADYLRSGEEQPQNFQEYDSVSHRLGWDDHIKKILEEAYGKFEWLEPKPDGSFVPLEVEGIRVIFNDKPVVVTYSRDVTKLRELEKEQQRAKVAEESNRAKTMFIANMSHEIRTPMNSILGYSELTLDDDTISNITREHLKKIVINAKLLLNIINDVLDISKIESGSLELEAITFNIREVMENCRLLLMPSVTIKGIMLNFKIDLPERRNLIGDPTKLTQICINLLSNAIKFTENGMVLCSVTQVKGPLHTKGCTLQFEFKDTGIGMTQEQLTQIFEPFVQADSSTTRKHGGTGLGLTITKRLIEAMGGQLSVESAIGLGSKFFFTLTFPVVQLDTSNTGSHPGKAAAVTKPQFNKGEVLVVDDNDMNLGVACEYLKRVGLNPFVAENGREAVEIVGKRMEEGKKPFDLIFMDMHMPEMDGKEAASIISGFNLGVPIIAMTAEAIALKDDASYKAHGMQGCLSKPFTAQELWKCLLTYLDENHV